MIRIIQNKLIIPRGDTGNFSLPVSFTASSNDIAVFTIIDPKTKKYILQKQITPENNVLNIRLEHVDTVNLLEGQYVWDVKYYQNAVFDDEVLVSGDEVDSYYAAYDLPTCEIRITGDALLCADDNADSKLSAQSINFLQASVNEAINAKADAIIAQAAAEGAADATTQMANELADLITTTEQACTNANTAATNTQTVIQNAHTAIAELNEAIAAANTATTNANQAAEAAATVEDHSLTYDKFVLGAFGYVTPEMYGAAGDGRTDDTKALQDCIAENDIVCMMGTYLISSAILLHNNLKIYGFGKGMIIKDTKKETQYAALCYYYDYNTISNLLEDVIIDGLTIVGVQHWTGDAVRDPKNDCGIRIRNITVDPAGATVLHSLDLVSKNITISRCHILECGACGIDINGYDCRIIDNTIIYTGVFNDPFDIDHPSNFNFGIFYNGNGFCLRGNVVRGVIHAICAGAQNKNVIITENNLSTSGQHGLYMEGAYNVAITGNTIHDCAIVGVKFQRQSDVDDFQDIVISDNVIQNCGIQGILVANIAPLDTPSANITITGNDIVNAQRGIQIIDAMTVTITGNNIVGEGLMMYGIHCTHAIKMLIANNIIKNTLAQSSTGGIYLVANELTVAQTEAGVLSKNQDIRIISNTFDNTTGLRITGDAMIENLDINENFFINSLGTDDVRFSCTANTQGAVIKNNWAPKGYRMTTGNADFRLAVNNIGFADSKKIFGFKVAASDRISLESDDCYTLGNKVYINLNFTILARGTDKTSLVVNPIPEIVSAQIQRNVNYTFVIPGSSNTYDLTLTFVNDGTQLSMRTKGGVQDQIYTFSTMF